MSSLQQAWKRAEKTIAEALVEAGISAERIVRANNYAKSDYDVRVHAPLDFLKIDSKYTRSKPFLANRLLKEIAAKYCTDKKRDEPVLVTRNYKDQDVCVTIRLQFFISLLTAYKERLTGNGKH